MSEYFFAGQRVGLFDLPPVLITELSGNEFGKNLGKKKLAQAADRLLRLFQQGDGLLNVDSGWVFKVNQKSRKKMGDNADMTETGSKAVAGIECLVRHAVLAEKHDDYEHLNPDILAVYRLYAPVAIGGLLYRAKLTVKDYVTLGNPKILHALAAVEIRNAPLGTLPSYSSTEVLQTTQPTTGRVITIAKLLNNATRYDGSEFQV